MVKRMIIVLAAILAAGLTPQLMPSAVAQPAGCLQANPGGTPGATMNLCATPTQEGGTTAPPREEPLPGSAPTRGPREPDPGGEDSPDPVPLPTPEPAEPSLPATACDPGVAYNRRLISCQTVDVPTVIYSPSTGQILGRGMHQVVTKTTRSPRQLTWNVEFKVKTTLARDAATSAGFRARIYYSECANCQLVTADGATRNIPLDTRVSWNFSITTRVGFNSSITARPRAHIVITHTNAALEADNDLGPGRYTRCDRFEYIGGNGGCVAPSFVPTFELPLNDPRWTQVAAHILRAQVNLEKHFGFEGLGRPLERITDASWRRLNGRVACKDTVVQQGVTSCDEYPFRSTKQGAAFEGYLNTSRLVVFADQNSRAGTELGIFYSANRVVSGDGFWVKVI